MNQPIQQAQSKKGFSVTAILVIGIVLIAGVSGYLVFKKSSQDETANWKVYKNLADGYQFRYPQDWFLTNDEGGELNERIFTDNTSATPWVRKSELLDQRSQLPYDTFGNFIVITHKSNNSDLQGWVNNLHYQRRDDAVLPPQFLRGITVDGINALQYKLDTIKGGVFISTYVLKDGNIYELRRETRIRTIYPEKQKEYDEALDTILASFRFL